MNENDRTLLRVAFLMAYMAFENHLEMLIQEVGFEKAKNADNAEPAVEEFFNTLKQFGFEVVKVEKVAASA